MATIEQSPCPACGAPAGALQLDEQLVADPIGSHSLAGVMLKVNARFRPVLTCTSCPLSLVGEYDGQRHVTFPPAGHGKRLDRPKFP